MKKKIMKNAAALLPVLIALCLTVQCSLEPEQAKPGKNYAESFSILVDEAKAYSQAIRQTF